MKKRTKKSKWRTYSFFIFTPGPARDEKQFSLPDDFSELDFTIPSRTSHSASGFPALFRVFTTRTDRCSAIRNWFTWRERSKNFQHFRSQRYKPSLTSRCNAKGKISGGIKGFLIKASVLWTKYCYLCLVCCRPCLFFKKLFISVGRIMIINLRFCFIA